MSVCYVYYVVVHGYFLLYSVVFALHCVVVWDFLKICFERFQMVVASLKPESDLMPMLSIIGLLFVALMTCTQLS